VFPRAKLPSKPRRGGAAWALAGPALAAILSLLVIGILLALTLPRLARPAPGPPESTEALEAALREGEQLLHEGKFHLSWQKLKEAVSLRAEGKGDVGQPLSWRLSSLYHQADALANLVPIPLEEVVRQARFERNPREWEERWKQFDGKAVLFDGVVKLDRFSRVTLPDIPIIADGQEARLELDDVALMNEVPLESNRRMIFAVKLKACARDKDGLWVVRFHPKSGVLMTEAVAVEAACSVPLDDGAKKVLAWQARWVANRGMATTTGK
jgi:hypothetical protein